MSLEKGYQTLFIMPSQSRVTENGVLMLYSRDEYYYQNRVIQVDNSIRIGEQHGNHNG